MQQKPHAVLFIILQQPLQLLACKEYPTLYCSQRQTKTVGNLAIFETGYVHQERYAIVTWQTMDNSVNLLCIIVIVGNVVIQLARAVYVEEIIGLVNEYLVTHLLAIVVDEDVAHYGVHPPLEICTGSVFLHITQRLQRRLLQQIVGLIPVSRQFIGKALQL